AAAARIRQVYLGYMAAAAAAALAALSKSRTFFLRRLMPLQLVLVVLRRPHTLKACTMVSQAKIQL
ncbi:MAG: hypothetical protein IJQ65_02785, partial [Kiritimatiellae bacterium]|nr:hypothetical protein [Kiritimatiellia bacterium]